MPELLAVDDAHGVRRRQISRNFSPCVARQKRINFVETLTINILQPIFTSESVTHGLCGQA
jgi:hypothetical protein